MPIEWDAEMLFEELDELIDNNPDIKILFDKYYDSDNELRVFIDIIKHFSKEAK